MKRVVLVGIHYWGSKRRAGFHFLAEAWRRAGWDVVFCTVSISTLSRLRGNHRFTYPVREEANRLVEKAPRLRSYVLYTTLHPVGLRPALLDRLLSPIWRAYRNAPLGALEQVLPGADLLVFESTVGLLLADRMARLAPHARLVYRVSDDLDLLGAPQVVIEEERRLVPRFDLISVPSRVLADRFAGAPNARVDLHGVRTDLFDAATDSPYPADGVTDAVFVGVNRLNRAELRMAAECKSGWRFHVIGPLANVPQMPNITTYGERPFADTVAYLRHADVGLFTIDYRPGVETLTDSLKVLQYTWCRLPIVAPDFIPSPREHFCRYVPNDRASLEQALGTAAAFDRDTIDRSGVRGWGDLASALAGLPS